LRRFYLEEMRPFLEQPKSRGRRLADEARATGVFAGLRTVLPAAVHNTLVILRRSATKRANSCAGRLHRWLHGWLLLHIPLSLALILLGAVHAVMALRY